MKAERLNQCMSEVRKVLRYIQEVCKRCCCCSDKQNRNNGGQNWVESPLELQVQDARIIPGDNMIECTVCKEWYHYMCYCIPIYPRRQKLTVAMLLYCVHA